MSGDEDARWAEAARRWRDYRGDFAALRNRGRGWELVKSAADVAEAIGAVAAKLPGMPLPPQEGIGKPRSLSMVDELASLLIGGTASLACEGVRILANRQIAKARRPFYYERENERRRAMRAERRQIRRRTTTSSCPTAEELMSAWNDRKRSNEAAIRFGSMVHDLECYVDNALRLDEDGIIVGRNGGIKEWLFHNAAELYFHYKTVMRYKALAKKLRQIAGISDPIPTISILGDSSLDYVAEILGNGRSVFSMVEEQVGVGWLERDAKS